MFSAFTIELLDKRLAPLARGEGVQCFYDAPEYSLELEPVSWDRFWKYAAAMAALPAAVFVVHPSYGPAVLIVGAGFIAWRLAQLKAHTPLAEGGVSNLWGGYLFWLVSTLALQGLASLAADVTILGFVLRWAYRLWATMGAVQLLGVLTIDDVFCGYCRRIPGLPRIVITDAALAERRERLRSLIETIPASPLFDADGAQVRAAWAARDVEYLTALFGLGATRTSCGWREGLDRFNDAAVEVDVARGHLRQALADVEDALRARGFSLYAMSLEGSQVLAGRMTPPELRLPSLQRQLDRGALHVAGSAMVGRVPWQVGAVAVGVAAVAHFAHESAALRRLADHEGELRTQAAVAREDLVLLATLTQTRLLPQFDRLVAMAAKLRHELAGSIEEQEAAVRLSRTLAEGWQLLKTSGGD